MTYPSETFTSFNAGSSPTTTTTPTPILNTLRETSPKATKASSYTGTTIRSQDVSSGSRSRSTSTTNLLSSKTPAVVLSILPSRQTTCDSIPAVVTSPSCPSSPRRDSSAFSVGSSSLASNTTVHSNRKEYMASLVPPTQDEFEKISRVQEQREMEIKDNHRQAKRQSLEPSEGRPSHDAEDIIDSPEQAVTPAAVRGSIDASQAEMAASTIQRTYRGYRSRREMNGLGLDATTRWVSAIQEAQFREKTRPRSQSELAEMVALSDDHLPAAGQEGGGSAGKRPSVAREKWKKAAVIARRAGHDDIESDSEGGPALSPLQSNASDDSPEKQAERRKRREDAVAKRKEASMMMGLPYFLEMVDQKHRYGSNLRIYHEEWKKQDTRENFFYWLDFGEGKDLEMAACPRDRLEREQVRYLSREERQHYLVTVDEQGRLCWAKNGQPIDTTEQYRDSIHGIVAIDDPTPPWRQPEDQPSPAPGNEDDTRSESSVESALEADRAAKYATPNFDNARGHNKIKHVSASTIFNKMLRKTVRKNTWIFVADNNFRLYVGIKASGEFQHSSFLQGSRISAGGLIKVKEGRLASLSPLSGHYRPPASNFKAFIRSLKDAGVDVSHTSISKSYAVLLGLETWVRTRKKGKDTLHKLTSKKEKLIEPEKVAQREEELKDKSESAAKERKVLEKQREQEELEKEENKATTKLKKKVEVVLPTIGDGAHGAKGHDGDGADATPAVAASPGDDVGR